METIKSKRDFEEVFSGGKRVSHRLVRATVLKCNEGDLGKVAFVAPKRLGNAVYRNRCKRVLREAARACGFPVQTARARRACHMVKRVLLALIRGYQKYLSPLFPPSCIYEPSCSQYALEAIGKYGALRGSWLAFKRILRCNPFHKGGYDPVP